MMFVVWNAEQVWVGREAARELCERAGMRTLVQDIVGDNYGALADAVRSVAGLKDEPDPSHGTSRWRQRQTRNLTNRPNTTVPTNAWNTVEAVQ